MMKKRIFACLLATCMMTGLASCGKTATDTGANDNTANTDTAVAQSGEKEPVTVTFWNGWTGPDGDLLKELVTQYNEKNDDNVTIDMDIMEFASLTEKLATALASNTNPNLHLGFATGEYALDKQYIPITDIFDQTELDQEDFDENILQSCYYEDELFGLPFQLTCTYMFWNKDLFEQAGLDPETPPATWEEVAAFSAQIDTLGGNIIGGGYGFNDSVTIGCMMRSYGGMVAADDGDGYYSTLTDAKYIEANKKALETMYAFTQQATSNSWTSGQGESFFAGTCGMIMGGAWNLAGCKDNNLNYGISLLPAGPDGIKMSTWPISMCVMKGTEGRALEGAYSFMEYWNNNLDNSITDESPAYRWTEQQGYQPYLLSVANDERLTGDADYQVTSSYIDYFDSYYPASFWNSYNLGNLVLAPLGENIVQAGLSIDDALALANQDLEAMIDEMRAKEGK